MTKIFISYAHEDEELRKELEKHLSELKRQKVVTIWSDEQIRPGEELDSAIKKELESADIILLLVSPDFLASTYCREIETVKALEQRQTRGSVTIPVILRPCDWQRAPFGRLKALPKDGNPVVQYPSRDEAFLEIVKALGDEVEAHNNKAQTSADLGSVWASQRVPAPTHLPAGSHKEVKMANSPKRRVFYSFHYEPDNWRASQVRNIGVIEGNRPATDNDWEIVKRGGDAAIARWLRTQMEGRTCSIVLVGTNTANRKWINYEISESWSQRMGIVGIHIHGLRNRDGFTSTRGENPFSYVRVPRTRTLMSTVVKCYNPPGRDSTAKYNWIASNLSAMVEEAIAIRNQF